MGVPSTGRQNPFKSRQALFRADVKDTPTKNTYGWRVVNNAFGQNKHAIFDLNCSEPPTV